MIPSMTLKQRLIAWLLWKFEGFDTATDPIGCAERRLYETTDLLTCVSLLRDYAVLRRSRYEQQG